MRRSNGYGRVGYGNVGYATVGDANPIAKVEGWDWRSAGRATIKAFEHFLTNA